jgi:hypothetical protein
MKRVRIIPVMIFDHVVRSSRCRHLACDASCSTQMLQWIEANWIPARIKKMLQASNTARDRDSMSMPSGATPQGRRSLSRIDRGNP